MTKLIFVVDFAPRRPVPIGVKSSTKKVGAIGKSKTTGSNRLISKTQAL